MERMKNEFVEKIKLISKKCREHMFCYQCPLDKKNICRIIVGVPSEWNIKKIEDGVENILNYKEEENGK